MNHFLRIASLLLLAAVQSVCFGDDAAPKASISPAPDSTTTLYQSITDSKSTPEQIRQNFEALSPEAQRVALQGLLADAQGYQDPRDPKSDVQRLFRSLPESTLNKLLVTPAGESSEIAAFAQAEINRQKGSTDTALGRRIDGLQGQVNDQGRRLSNAENNINQLDQNQKAQQAAQENQLKNNQQIAAAGATPMGGQEKNEGNSESAAPGAVQMVSTTPGTNVKSGEQPVADSPIVAAVIPAGPKGIVFDTSDTGSTARGLATSSLKIRGFTANPATLLTTQVSGPNAVAGRATLPQGYGITAAAGSSSSSRFIVDNHMAGIVGAAGGSSYSQIYGADVRQDAISRSVVNGGRSPASRTVLEAPTTAAGGHRPR